MSGIRSNLFRFPNSAPSPARGLGGLLSVQTRGAFARVPRTERGVRHSKSSSNATFIRSWRQKARNAVPMDATKPRREIATVRPDVRSSDPHEANSEQEPAYTFRRVITWDRSKPGARFPRAKKPRDDDGQPSKATKPRDAVKKALKATKPVEDTNNIVHVSIEVDGQPYEFSTLLLRDLCTCAQCVDVSTRQKLFSTTDIPADINATSVSYDSAGHADITWSNDIHGCGEAHVSRFELQALKSLALSGQLRAPVPLPSRKLWNSESYRDEVKDLEYEAYMQDDRVLLTALQTLYTHGLLFLTNVPESEASVQTITERIGPVKNTFYGMTWDVRAVPQAKNVAYTSQDLGFHMDLLYMEQPPHLQFLHCLRSSTSGGASLFTDSYNAATDLFVQDWRAIEALKHSHVNYHYDHLPSQHYHQRRKVVKLRPYSSSSHAEGSVKSLVEAAARLGIPLDKANFGDYIDAISWAPPFQAPFPSKRTTGPLREWEMKDTKADLLSGQNRRRSLNDMMTRWHAAATKFSALIHRPEAIYERMMRPGECVIFDNRRVLHARKAFEVEDGKERWLRGAYLDKDPCTSRLEGLQQRFGIDGTQIEELHTAADTVTSIAVGA